MSEKLWGGAHIAKVMGVSAPAFANWRRRYEDTPAPTHEVVDGMPLWNAQGLENWKRWHATRFAS